MKKWMAIILAAVLVLGMSACTVNKTEVSVLWSADGVVKTPDSLINAMERAMYIENIAYAHYGAEGDSAKQLEQVKQALEKDCAALVVELVNPADAQSVVDQAKLKNIPVIFFNCEVDAAVLDSYEKSTLIRIDAASAAKVQGEMIGKALTAKKGLEKADLNGDGKVSYLALGNVEDAVANVDQMLADAELAALVKVEAEGVSQLTVHEYVKKKDTYGQLKTASGEVVELIITENDAIAMDALVELQALGFNKDKLATHFVTVYTVGSNADYKEKVLAGKPEGALNSDAVQAYFREQAAFADLTTVEAGKDLEKMQSQMDVLVYNTRNVIDAGRIIGSAVEDYDAVAESVAKATRSLLKGNAPEHKTQSILYTTYGA